MAERSKIRWAVAAAAATCAAGAAIGTAFGAVVALAVGFAGLSALLVFTRVSFAHGALTRRLRGRSTEAEVAGTRLRLGTVGGSVFVAGLSRPDIFCDAALLDDLDDDEVSAVTLHERAHQLARDPLRNAVVAAVAPLLLRFLRGRDWLQRRAAAREIAADRYAMANGVDRRAIASALLKVPPAGAAHAAGFGSAVDLRLQALLGDEVDLQGRRSWLAVTVGAIAGAAVCLAMLHPAAPVAEIVQACCPV
jgi:beta-lactamase regulating signal transducer with metallopeptidase domain